MGVRHYLAAKLGADDAELERWVGATDGLSLAACAEPVISVRYLGHGLEETVELLRRAVRGRVSTRRTTTRAVYRRRASSQRALAGIRHSVDASSAGGSKVTACGRSRRRST
jgi:hypothetical protein